MQRFGGVKSVSSKGASEFRVPNKGDQFRRIRKKPLLNIIAPRIILRKEDLRKNSEFRFRTFRRFAVPNSDSEKLGAFPIPKSLN